MKLKRAGFFSELTHGMPGGGSLHDRAGAAQLEHRDPIAAYLEAGAYIITSGGRTKDPVSGQVTPYALGVQTDGTWAWPSDLPHYVREYGSALPAEFVDWMAAQGWQCPHLKDAELSAAGERF